MANSFVWMMRGMIIVWIPNIIMAFMVLSNPTFFMKDILPQMPLANLLLAISGCIGIALFTICFLKAILKMDEELKQKKEVRDNCTK